MVSLSQADVFLSWHHRLVFACFLGLVEFEDAVVDGIVERVGEEFIGSALLAQYLVVHSAVAQQAGLGAGRFVVFVVEELYRVGGDGDHTVAGRGAAHPEVVEFFLKALQLAWCFHRGHGDEHFLEGLVVVERHDGHLAQGDGVAAQGDEQGVATQCHGRVDGDEAAGIADAAHPKGVDALGGDDEAALHVADGAAVSHLADDVGVADGFPAVGGNHIAVVHAAALAVDLAFLGLGDEAARHQD